ncbi:MAG: hypothetical protein HY051_00340 [Candidatus Aenigmarchaeota archaeon]|nr:hypothetical protein [Candidatus Aenigmarchaeota archaeon]
MIFGTGIDLGLALLLAVVFVKYAGIKLGNRPLNLLTAGAMFFILAGVLNGANLGFTLPAIVDTALNTIGAIAVVLGVLWSACLLTTAKK